jgi:hypothetical protein
MDALVIILLAIIAYILWLIYKQREDDKRQMAYEKYQVESEQKEKELISKYPHLVNKLEDNWLQVFSCQSERGTPLLKLAFMLYLQESTKIDYSEGSQKWDTLWDLTEELLEHLEKFHEGSVIEHEIAITTYWQITAEAVGELIKENPKIDGKKMEAEPFTNITKIVSLFPKKANHADKEFAFFDENGLFPRESNGSQYIKDKLKALGL